MRTRHRIPSLFNLSPDTFTYLMFVSAAAAAIGRFRSIPIAMAAGLALGIAQDLVAAITTRLGPAPREASTSAWSASWLRLCVVNSTSYAITFAPAFARLCSTLAWSWRSNGQVG